jgi:hypothetical protein
VELISHGHHGSRANRVAIMTPDGFDIGSIPSNVDKTDTEGIIFSRDCAEYEVRTPNGVVIHVLVNHFKSQSGGDGAKRKRQAKAVRKIVNEQVTIREQRPACEGA